MAQLYTNIVMSDQPLNCLMAQLDTSAWQYLYRRASFFMTHRFFLIYFNIEKKLWKVLQSEVKQMMFNLKSDAPIVKYK